MEGMESLADFLGVGSSAPEKTSTVDYKDLTPKQFCQAILNSQEFRSYILSGIQLGDLPAAVIIRIMDVGWGKPTEHIEHTGKDGKPIESVTEVRRVLVRVNNEQKQQSEEADAPYITH